MCKQLTRVLLLWTIGACALAETPAKTWMEPDTGMHFVAVPKGCFQMGSRDPVPPPPDTTWQFVGYKGTLSENEQPQHEVCLDAFWMGKYEVQRKEWRALMGDEPKGATARDDNDMPVVRVTWEQAQRFAQKLNERAGGKHRYRLPTEAQWEYVCRIGTAKAGAPDRGQLAQIARYGLGTPKWDRFGPNLGAVGQKQANVLGVYDMLGNVWEWTEDAYQADAYSRHVLFNPRVNGATASAPRVIRGGSFRTEFELVRCSKRGRQPENEALDSLGFRLIRELGQD